MKNKRVITFFVLLLVSLGQFAIDIYLPSFPSMVHDFQTTPDRIQLTLTLFLIGFALSQLVYGPLSDRFGRRKILIFGLSLFIVAAVGATLAQTVSQLILLRFVQGVGIGAANVLCRAILRDLYEGKELAKKISLLGILWVTSPVIAPVIGGYIQAHFEWRMNFVFLALFNGCIWLWVIFCLPETKNPAENHSIHPKQILKNYRLLLSNRAFVGYVFADFFLYGLFSAFYVAGPFLFQQVLGLSPVLFGWMMLIISSGYLLGSALNIRLIHFSDIQKVIWIGISLIIAVSATMFFISLAGVLTIYSLVIPMSLLFLGVAFVFTNCIGKALAIFPSITGTASALWGFLAYLGGTIATAVMTRFKAETSLPLSGMLFTLCMLTFLILFLFRPKENSVR